MFLRTKSFQICRAFANLLMARICQTGNVDEMLKDTHLVLYQTGPIPSFDADLTNYVLCDFAGYAAVALATMLGPVNFDADRVGYHKECDFTAGAIVADQQAAGALILNAANDTIIAVDQFDAPFVFHLTGDTLSYDAIVAPRTLFPGESEAAPVV